VIRADVIRELADYYDKTDTTAEADSAILDETVVREPMITTSVRLPRPMMLELRSTAARRGMRPSDLIRELVAGHLAGDASVLRSVTVREAKGGGKRSAKSGASEVSASKRLAATAGRRVASDKRAVAGKTVTDRRAVAARQDPAAQGRREGKDSVAKGRGRQPKG